MLNVVVPEDLDLALEILSKENATIIAGGTDLMVKIRQNKFTPDVLVDITKIRKLSGIKKTSQNLEIGTITTHSELINSKLIPPILRKAASEIGSPQIRNLGTIGGNIVNASPAGDTIVPLYLLDATICIRSFNGNREMDIKDFIKGPGKVSLKQGEIVEKICITSNLEDYTYIFEKVGERNAMTIAIVSMGILLKLHDKAIEDIRIAFGSVAPTVLRMKEVETFLTGKELNYKNLSEASAIIESTVSPITDVRATANYRRKVAGRLIYRLIEI